MHPTTKFFLLLILMTFFVFFIGAAALPTKRQTGLLTLPIRSLHGHVRRDIHPQLYLQQQINRADRRLARMMGRALPSDDELRARLHKRMHIINRTIYHGRDASNIGSGVSPLDIHAHLSNAVTSAISPTAANSAGLDILAADNGYVTHLQIGTPPASFRVMIDTGSADFWVGSQQCMIMNQSGQVTGESCGQHQFLGSNSSSTFVDTEQIFKLAYSVGSIFGTVVKDTVTISGLVLANHSFGAANSETSFFSNNPIDGSMGLARSNGNISTQLVPTLVEALHTQGLIPATIVSYKISRLADQKNDGEIVFGGLDPTKFDLNTLVTIPNTSPMGFWQAPIDAITVDGLDTGLKGLSAILDTGVPWINAPLASATAIHNLINGSQPDHQGGFTLPCTSTASVALTFGSQIFPIDSRDLALYPLDTNDPTGTCVSAIIGTDSAAQFHLGSNLWVVGDVFLKNAYFSTNNDNNTISFAKLV